MKFRLTPPHNLRYQRSCALYKQVRGCWQFQRNVPDDGQQATIPLFTRQTLHSAGFSIWRSIAILWSRDGVVRVGVVSGWGEMASPHRSQDFQDVVALLACSVHLGLYVDETSEDLHLQLDRMYGLQGRQASVTTAPSTLSLAFSALLAQRCDLGFQPSHSVGQSAHNGDPPRHTRMSVLLAGQTGDTASGPRRLMFNTVGTERDETQGTDPLTVARWPLSTKVKQCPGMPRFF